jgi:hypothetical protein
MVQKANITVYLQALGAHYLGANAFKGNEITLNLVYSKGTVKLPYRITPDFTDDGNPSSSFTAGASSFMPIMTVPQLPTQPETLVHFLSPDFATACGKGDFELPAKPELARLQISVPITAVNKPLQLEQSVLLNPAQPEYLITVPIPGLYLSPNEVTSAGISVFVKMMCGCAVTLGPPASLWPANDFTVYANVLDTSDTITSYALSYDEKQISNSLFSKAFSSPVKAIKSVTFTAIQKSTGNYGALIVEG